MDMLGYWKWRNFIADMADKDEFDFNSNQSRLHSAAGVRDRLWLVTGRPTPAGRRYLLVGSLRIIGQRMNPAGFCYGAYRVIGDPTHTFYYSPNAPDLADLLLGLDFASNKRITSRERIGQSLQTLRSLTSHDSALLAEWAKRLPLHPRSPQFGRTAPGAQPKLTSLPTSSTDCSSTT